MTLPPPAANPDFLDLAELLQRGRSASHPVASAGGAEHSWEDFVRGVSGWHQRFSVTGQQRFALYHADAWVFATALFGGWLARKVLLLPGDTQAATLSALASEVDGFAGEFPADLGKPRIAEAVPSSRLAPSARLDLQWPGLVVMTSGSTGRPTPFVKRLAQLGDEVRAQELCFGAQLGKARLLSTVSHQHIYGLLFRVLWPLCAGRVFESRQLYFPEEIIAHAERARSVALVSSPAHLKRLPETLPWSAVKSRFRAVFSSGGPLEFASAELCRDRLGHWPLEIYGSSETGGVAYRERSSAAAAWRTLPRVEVEVDPEDDCLRVRSPHLFDDAWFTTSDRVRALADGSFELVGRKDRVVKIEEKRVSLEALEAGLLKSGLCDAVRVVVLAGARIQLGAVVVPNEAGADLARNSGKLALNQALREAASGSVERVGLPRRFRYLDALPLSAQGKLSEHALRVLFAEEDR